MKPYREGNGKFLQFCRSRPVRKLCLRILRIRYDLSFGKDFLCSKYGVQRSGEADIGNTLDKGFNIAALPLFHIVFVPFDFTSCLGYNVSIFLELWFKSRTFEV